MCLVSKLQQKVKDYCTFWFEGNWKSCCKEHDDNYRKGISRLESDKLFLKCLLNVTNKVIGYAMYGAVRLFGWIFYNKDKNNG